MPYDRDSMCQECGGKAGEHSLQCNYGSELANHYALIERNDEERRRRCHEQYLSDQRNREAEDK